MKYQLSQSLFLIKDLRTEIKLLKNGRKSDTSSTPSSQDYGKSKKNNNLREKSGKKSGGQFGHKGSSLKMSEEPDEIKKYIPQYCKQCGEKFSDNTVFELNQRKQEVVIPPIIPRYLEHQSYGCICNKCHTQTIAEMPMHLKSNIQYGNNIHALIAYLSVYQFMPSNRIKGYFKDIMNLSFLYYLEVPPDNNGSERAFRNAKVKMKVSYQFKSIDFATHYAIIRSVIDTTIKNSNNVFEALSCLANQNLIAAE